MAKLVELAPDGPIVSIVSIPCMRAAAARRDFQSYAQQDDVFLYIISMAYCTVHSAPTVE